MSKDKKTEAKESKSVESQVREAHQRGDVVADIAEKHNLEVSEVLAIVSNKS